MRVRAAQKFSFNHAGNNKITSVPGPAGNFIGTINSPDRSADDGEIALNVQVETFLLAENPIRSVLRDARGHLT
jgi:hypothetical protein